MFRAGTLLHSSRFASTALTFKYSMEDYTESFVAEVQEEDAMAEMYLAFNLGSQHYALDISTVVEIIGIQAITEVPDVAPYIQGVINLRGKVIPVMDVRLRFNMPHRGYDDRTCIIVVSVQEVNVGLIVDRVAEVINIPDKQIQAPPSVGHDNVQLFMKGLGKLEKNVKLLLDTEKLLFDHA